MSNANSNTYTVTRKILYICRAQRGLGLDESEFTKSVLFFTLLGYITSVNNSIVFIAGITPTNYSVSYIVNKINAYERV